MAELVIMNGASNLARSVLLNHLARNTGKYASVKLVDARPYRQSVYTWQHQLGGVEFKKQMARTVQSIDLSLEGASDVLYFTHDYSTMSSDKNAHLEAVAKLTKKHGVSNVVAVCPIEHDLAWSEDDHTFYQKTNEAEANAVSSNPNLTLFKTNLTFGPHTHLIHFLTQCAIVGKSPYSNILGASKFKYAPIHTDDVTSAVGSALQGGHAGRFTLSGNDSLTLRQIMDTLEK